MKHDLPSKNPRPRDFSSGNPRALLTLAIAVMLFAASGAACPQMLTQYTSPLPRILPDNAALPQIMAAVNDNTAKIHSLQANQASITVAGVPTLRANIACEPMRHFRLRADTMLTGPELDVGSNDELFWMSVRRPTPTMYFCRHEQFATTTARQFFPVEPQWLVEALGIVRLDSSDNPSGPEPLTGGKVQIRTTRQTSTGPTTKILMIDNLTGVILEQSLYDARGQRLATAVAGKHLRDPASGAIVPQHVEVNWPAANLSFKLDMYDLSINTLPPGNMALWMMPNDPSVAKIDLADPNLQMVAPGTMMPQPGPVVAPPMVPGAMPPLTVPTATVPPPTSSYVPQAAIPTPARR